MGNQRFANPFLKTNLEGLAKSIPLETDTMIRTEL